MTTRTAHTPRTARSTSPAAPPQPEQLSMLQTSDLPVQFRLDRRTRERGLEHVAEIRRLLAAKHAGPSGTITTAVTTTAAPAAARHDQAA